MSGAQTIHAGASLALGSGSVDPNTAIWTDSGGTAIYKPDGVTEVAVGSYLGEYLFANAPDPSTVDPYSRFFATDADRWKEYMVSQDGTQWIPFNGGFVPRRKALLTVACGNSIAVISKTSAGVQGFASDLHHANQFSGRPMRFELMNAATTRSDVYGVYGYSGQTLPTILADITTQWHDQISGSGVNPELVIGHSLLENDVSGGATVAAMTASLDTWIKLVRAWWPGCMILLFTPRPSPSNNTPTLVSNFAGITDYMLSLDNGVDIFVTQLNSYESSTSPATPIVGNVTGSRSGTTFTVATTDVVLGIGDTIITDVSNNCKISAYGTGTGGAGTYTVINSGTPSTTGPWTVAQYTDASVHPTTRGAMLNARKIKWTFARMASVWEHPSAGGAAYAITAAMTGTAAASGTNVTGTVPTSSTVAGSASGNFVSTALQPGWQIAVNNNSQGYKTDISTFSQSAVTHIAGAAKVQQFCEVEIVSGAANLGALVFTPRQFYGTSGGSNGFFGGMLFNTGDQEGAYEDGDVLILDSLPMSPTSGGFTQVTNYLRPWMGYQTGTSAVTLIIRSMGAYSPASSQQGIIYAPAAAGTVTVDASLGDTVHIIMPAGNITMAAPTNPRTGKRLTFTILQDSGGSRTITWNAAFKKAADGAGGANTAGATSFIYNGTNWVQQGALAFA